MTPAPSRRVLRLDRLARVACPVGANEVVLRVQCRAVARVAHNDRANFALRILRNEHGKIVIDGTAHRAAVHREIDASAAPSRASQAADLRAQRDKPGATCRSTSVHILRFSPVGPRAASCRRCSARSWAGTERSACATPIPRAAPVGFRSISSSDRPALRSSRSGCPGCQPSQAPTARCSFDPMAIARAPGSLLYAARLRVASEIAVQADRAVRRDVEPSDANRHGLGERAVRRVASTVQASAQSDFACIEQSSLQIRSLVGVSVGSAGHRTTWIVLPALPAGEPRSIPLRIRSGRKLKISRQNPDNPINPHTAASRRESKSWIRNGAPGTCERASNAWRTAVFRRVDMARSLRVCRRRSMAQTHTQP